MTTVTQSFIRPSQEFFGQFEVVRTTLGRLVIDGTYQTVKEDIIPCANLATARSYIEGTREYNIAQNQIRNRNIRNKPQPTIDCVGFCSPTGQYYAVVEMPDMDIRIDCHNSATLRGWMKNGVGYGALMEALGDETNCRSTGGWNG